MSITDRNTLKGFFKNGLIPVEEHFASLIDSGINTLEDGIEKEAGQPLKIQASTMQEDFVHFYGLLSDPLPAWRINQKPDPGVEGLTMMEGTGHIRLFIEKGTGKVGIGTSAPQDQLHLPSGKIRIGTTGGIVPSWMNFANTQGLLTFTDSDFAFFGQRNRGGESGGGNVYDTVIAWGDDAEDNLVLESTFSGEAMRITGAGKVGIGISAPQDQLHLNNGKVRIGTMSGNVPGWMNFANTQGLITFKDSDFAFFGQRNRGGESGGGNTYDTVIAWGDDADDNLILESTFSGEAMRLTGMGKVGMGVSDPQDRLHLNNGKVRIGQQSGIVPGWMSFANTQGLVSFNDSDFAFFGQRNRGGENGVGNLSDTVIAWGDDADDNLVFDCTYSGEAMRITGTGKVGIGTQSPDAGFRLSVEGNTLTDYLQVRNTTGVAFDLNATAHPNQHWRMGVDSAGLYVFNISDQARHLFVEQGSGNIGMGGIGNPSAPLHIQAAANKNSPHANGLYIYNPNREMDAVGCLRVAGAGNGDPFLTLDIEGVAGWSLGVDNSDNQKFKISGMSHTLDQNNWLTIDKVGNVGIGTASPTQSLHVASGKILIGGELGLKTTWIDHANTKGMFVGAGSDNAFFGLKNRGGAAGGDNDYDAVVYWGDDTTDDLVFEHHQGERMRLSGEGFLGIGTNNPRVPLHIMGPYHGQQGGDIFRNGMGGHREHWAIGTSEWIGAYSYKSWSDERVKENPVPLASAQSLEMINQLNLVDYKHIPEYGGGRKGRGVYAQEVQPLFPEAVSIFPAMELSNGESLEDFLSVDYNWLFVTGLSAIQELSQANLTLKQELAELRKDLESVKG